MQALVQTDGTFQLSHMPAPPQRNDRWAYRIYEERDCTGLTAARVSEAQDIEEIVLDRSLYNFTNKGKPTASYRTVSVHLRSNGAYHMVSVKRRDELNSTEADSLARLTFDDCTQFVGALKADEKASALKLSGRPLLSLDPEFSHPDERRMLVADQIPYAILLEPDHPFKRVVRPPGVDQDAFDYLAVEHIFDYYDPGRDRSQINVLPVCDLLDRDARPARRVTEVLAEVTVNDMPTYFLTRPALSPPHELSVLREAKPLARRAADLTLDGPAKSLRMHQFHHPHDDRYYTVLNIVASGRGE